MSVPTWLNFLASLKYGGVQKSALVNEGRVNASGNLQSLYMVPGPMRRISMTVLGELSALILIQLLTCLWSRGGGGSGGDSL